MSLRLHYPEDFSLEIFLKIIDKCNKLLKNNGMLILEIGEKQGKELSKL